MTKSEADRFMNEQLEGFVEKARAAQSDEEQMKFTDAAHKIYITLTQVDAFEPEHGSTVSLGS